MLQFKRDYGIYAVWIVVVGGIGYLIATGKVTWELGVGFLTLLGLPSLLGKKDDDNKKDPPAGGASPLLVAVTLSIVLAGASACTPAARFALMELLAKKIACGVAHQDLPLDAMAKVCSLEPGDIPLVMQAVGESRAASAREAVHAANRAGAARCVEGAKP